MINDIIKEAHIACKQRKKISNIGQLVQQFNAFIRNDQKYYKAYPFQKEESDDGKQRTKFSMILTPIQSLFPKKYQRSYKRKLSQLCNQTNKSAYKRSSFKYLPKQASDNQDLSGSMNQMSRSNSNQSQIKYSSIMSQSSIGQRLLQINNYKFLYTLGKGAFSQVKLAIDEKKNKKYAVKITSKKMILKKCLFSKQKQNLLQLIQKEMKIMTKLNHPNIIKLFQIIKDQKGEYIYLILDYCQFGSINSKTHLKKLKQLNKIGNDQKSIPQHLLKHYFRQIVSGLDYCKYSLLVHNKAGIVHKDIKPDNLLINQDNQLKIADFGISCICQNNELSKGNFGTKSFMAPQAFEGQYQLKPNDIWAIGVSLYNLIYLKLPFSIEQDENKAKVIRHKELQFPNAYITQQCKDFMRSCFKKNPSQRLKVQQLKVNNDNEHHPWLLGSKSQKSYQ